MMMEAKLIMQKVAGKFFVASSDPKELFDAIEKSFDQVAIFVLMAVIFSLLFPIGFGWAPSNAV